MRKHRSPYLGRDSALHGYSQFTDPVAITRIATILIPLYLTLAFGASAPTFAVAIVLMVAGLAASTEFSRPDTYVDRLARTYRRRQLDKRDHRRGNASENGDQR
ncbi:hypothetical protein [Rhodococcus qingshengii]|uniref:hypothetical protein n=1 Tax=Rhodococcus qingshengii TaxID=334542 RepID=UPI00237C56E6|nr:hypothetical protein [Rhodococcus qingshengii]WCT06211.1 hypothetical protein PI247_31890 [Rhodococcus qingshengii]